MGNAIDMHQTLVIINFIKHAIVANLHTPLILKADQPLDTSVARVSF